MYLVVYLIMYLVVYLVVYLATRMPSGVLAKNLLMFPNGAT